MLNSTVSIVALREAAEQRKAFGRPVLMCSFVMPPINIHASPHLFIFIPQIPGMGLCRMNDYFFFSGKNHNIKGMRSCPSL